MNNKNSKNRNKTGYIYKHTCIVNGYSYIGQTSAYLPKYRWGRNGKQYKNNNIFWQAIQKYGGDNFTHEILESGIKTLEEANQREKYGISFYNTGTGSPDCKGYNIMQGGENHWYIASDETRLKMSQAKLGKLHSTEYKERLSEISGGKKIICIETQIIYFGKNEAERVTGIRHIGECCHHQREIAGGYHWSYVDDFEGQQKFIQFKNKDRHISKYAKRSIICVETGEIFESITQAKLKYKGCISKVLSGERATAAGYHWRYIDD